MQRFWQQVWATGNARWWLGVVLAALGAGLAGCDDAAKADA